MKKRILFLIITTLVLYLMIVSNTIASDTQKSIWIQSTFNSRESMHLIQDWIKKNQDKRIISIAADPGSQNGWLIVYTDKDKEENKCDR